MRQLTMLDSTGIATLVAVYRAGAAAGGVAVQVSNPDGVIRRGRSRFTAQYQATYGWPPSTALRNTTLGNRQPPPTGDTTVQRRRHRGRYAWNQLAGSRAMSRWRKMPSRPPGSLPATAGPLLAG
ncbi:hypothetical protein ABT297_41960 [Dactylosporangium sp. NPDC000555]|uniref:hypothetical protein n=1 Tax=Dactylosporangium sp. NPDC000555 TaxID=3154260 RepID=UPI0033217ABF